MDSQLKQRVVGAAVLVALGVVFIPIFLDETNPDQQQAIPFEVDPTPPEGFSSRVVPLDDERMDRLVQAMDATPEELSAPADWDDESAARDTPGSPITGQQDDVDAGVMPPVDTPNMPPKAPIRTGVTAWVVQVGSFGSEQNAAGLVESLNKSGYKAFIEPLRDQRSVTYRVRVGPVLTKAVADETREQLAKEAKVNGIVMRYP